MESSDRKVGSTSGSPKLSKRPKWTLGDTKFGLVLMSFKKTEETRSLVG